MKLEKKYYPESVWQITALVQGRRPPQDEVETKWRAYHRHNPHVFQAFERYALEAMAAGKAKGSAWLIINRMRWDDYIAAHDDNSSFTISNDYIALYARYFMERYGCVEFFNTKLRPMEGVRLAKIEREREGV